MIILLSTGHALGEKFYVNYRFVVLASLWYREITKSSIHQFVSIFYHGLFCIRYLSAVQYISLLLIKRKTQNANTDSWDSHSDTKSSTKKETSNGAFMNMFAHVSLKGNL